MKHKTILFLSVFCCLLHNNLVANDTIETKVAQNILLQAQRLHIDPRVLFTVIDIESAFNPNAICVETSKAKADVLSHLASDTIRIKIGKTYHSKIWMVSIFPKDKQDALVMSKLLKQLGFSYDAGLMQINSGNFKQAESEKIFDIEYNIRKGASIFKSCAKQFKQFVHQVECYNRGAGNLRKSLRKGKKYYPYYKQYQKKWDF